MGTDDIFSFLDVTDCCAVASWEGELIISSPGLLAALGSAGSGRRELRRAPFLVVFPVGWGLSGQRCSAWWKGHLEGLLLEHCDSGIVWKLARSTGK